MCAQIRARIGLWHVFSQFDLLFFAAAATAIALITEWPSWVTNEHFPTKESVEQLIIGLYLELLEMTHLATCIIRYGSEKWRNNVRNITHLQWVLMCICPLYRNSNVSVTLYVSNVVHCLWQTAIFKTTNKCNINFRNSTLNYLWNGNVRFQWDLMIACWLSNPMI